MQKSFCAGPLLVWMSLLFSMGEAGCSETAETPRSPAQHTDKHSSLQLAQGNEGAVPIPYRVNSQKPGNQVYAKGTAVYRLNAGGPPLAGKGDTPGWGGDTSDSPSRWGNAKETGNRTYRVSKAIAFSPSVPLGTPPELFQTERWAPPESSDMVWRFPVSPGTYHVRLHFAEIYEDTQAVGARKFRVYLEGQLFLDDYDIYSEVGGYAGVTKAFDVLADDYLNVRFEHDVENPALKGIEIILPQSANGIETAPD